MTFGRNVMMAVVALSAAALRAESQVPTVGSMPVACTYETCALRIENGFFSINLVKGQSGEKVSRLGGFGSGVDVLLAGPDSAARYARSYVTASRWSNGLTLIGGIAFGLAIASIDDWNDSSIGSTEAVVAVAGAGILVVSIPFSLKAQRSLARAVWWYNEELAR
jgi:hypothetical protein